MPKDSVRTRKFKRKHGDTIRATRVAKQRVAKSEIDRERRLLVRERKEEEKEKAELQKAAELKQVLKKAKDVSRQSVAATSARAGMMLGDFFAKEPSSDSFSSAFEEDAEDANDHEDPDANFEGEDEEEDGELDFGEYTESATLGGVFDREGQESDDDEEEDTKKQTKKTPAQRRQEMIEELLEMRQANPDAYTAILKENPYLAKLVASYRPSNVTHEAGSDDEEDGDDDHEDEEDEADEEEKDEVVEESKPDQESKSKGKKHLVEQLTKAEYLQLRDELAGMRGIAVANKALHKVVEYFKSAGRAYLELSQVKKVQVKDAMSGTQMRSEKRNLDRNIKAKQLQENQRLLAAGTKLTIHREAELIALTSSKLFGHFLQYAARAIPLAMATHFLPKEVADDPAAAAAKLQALDTGVTLWAPTALEAHPGWNRVRRVARDYFITLLNLFASVAEPTMIRVFLHHSLPALPYLEGIPEYAPKVFKALLTYWVGVAGTSIGKEAVVIPELSPDVRLEAFLAIRRLCVTLPPRSQMLEAALKGVYLAYVRECKTMDARTAASVFFMTNCVTDLYGIDKIAAYQHAFVYIRQLAVHLRAVIQDPDESKVRSVYSWQFLNCLRVWSSILSAHAATAESALRPLVYPFIQVCLATLELQSSANYFPVRVYVAEFISNLAQATKTYVPLSPYLFSILRSSILHKKLTGMTRGIEAFRYRLHISDEILKSPGYQVFITNATLDQLTMHLAQLSTSIAFPELMLPVKHFVKTFIRDLAPSVAKPARELLSAINESINLIIQKRSNVPFSPRDMLIRGISGLTTFDNTTALPGLQLKKKSQHRATPLEALWKRRQQLADVGSEIVLGKRGREEEAEESDDEPNEVAAQRISKRQVADDDEEEEEDNAVEYDDDEYDNDDGDDNDDNDDVQGVESDADDDDMDASDLEDVMRRNTQIGADDESEDEVEEFVFSDADDASDDEDMPPLPSKKPQSKSKSESVTSSKLAKTQVKQQTKRVKK